MFLLSKIVLLTTETMLLANANYAPDTRKACSCKAETVLLTSRKHAVAEREPCSYHAESMLLLSGNPGPNH